MSLRPRPLPTEPTRTLHEVLAVGLASQHTHATALSIDDEEEGAVGAWNGILDEIDRVDAILGVDQLLPTAARKSVGQVLLGHLQTLRVENNKSGTDGEVYYALVYKGITIGTVYYFGKMGYRAWMTHAMYYGPVAPIEKQYVTRPTAKKMLGALGGLLQKLQFAPVIREIEWKLVKYM